MTTWTKMNCLALRRHVRRGTHNTMLLVCVCMPFMVNLCLAAQRKKNWTLKSWWRTEDDPLKKKKNPIFMVILFRFLNACTMFVYTTVHIWHGDTHTGDIATNRYLHKKSLYVAAVIQTHIFGQINRRNVNFWADDGVVTFCSTHHHMHKPQTGTFANWFHFVRACGKCFFFLHPFL